MPSPQAIFSDLQATFESGLTKDLQWRKDALRKLDAMLRENYEEIVDAFIQDLGGGDVRVIVEIDTVLEAVKCALANLDEWAADRPAALGNLPAEVPGLDRRLVRPTPKGVTLVIGAWNYPINLLLDPAVGMIAAGNCVMMKPSEIAPNVAAVVEKLVHEYLPREAVRVVQGGVEETTAILEMPFDHICYTGSTAVGKIVMAAAAKHLTPCTLELGGKCPIFVHKSAKLRMAATRIVFGKSANAGQWCVSPDYVVVDEAKLDDLVKQLVDKSNAMNGDCSIADNVPRNQRWWNKIVNSTHAKRVMAFLEEDHGGEVVLGGLERCDPENCFIPFTIVINPKPSSKLMTEEIFGPILVIVPVKDIEKDAIQLMKSVYNTPLALYVFSEDKQYTERILNQCTSGMAVVNTVNEQCMSETVPFGGVGRSGMGAYKGRSGFEEFSHMRAMLYRTTLVPLHHTPEFMHPMDNAFPDWVPGLVVKKYFYVVPRWVTRALLVGGLAAGMACCKSVWDSIVD